MCGKSDNHKENELLQPVWQADDTMGRLGTAAAAGTVAGAAAGAIHNVLTSLYTNMTLRSVIAYVVQKNNELGDAVNKSDLSQADKESIKAALDTINEKLQEQPTLDTINEKLQEQPTLFQAIKDQIGNIKEKIGVRMPELMQGMAQAYRGLAVAYGDANHRNIYLQSVVAGAAVGGVTLLGSLYARRIQTAIENYFKPSSSDAGQLGGKECIPICRWENFDGTYGCFC